MKFEYNIKCESKEEFECIGLALQNYKQYLIKQIDNTNNSECKKADYWLKLSMVNGIGSNFDQYEDCEIHDCKEYPYPLKTIRCGDIENEEESKTVFIVKNSHGAKIEKIFTSEKKTKEFCENSNNGLLQAIYTYQECEVD